ncbi:uncharacterized protein B0H18DRAFT_330243 [Fomitopsis serialis]|uniref:uncharacterized protein n=1 Tax=Fomitopsis serialis TaxID=139415 RepID=UPI002007A5F6|nr:uncharacterized protein B0H18DRAFT_330243 [Neoantrodia serialis]KAH9926695.1 hypothetical protein B0H18DRAFT_330243 [Neoantrodia serialis]
MTDSQSRQQEPAVLWNSKRHIVTEEDSFNKDMSIIIRHILKEPVQESPLYGLYGSIISTSTATIKYPGHPIIVTPQALFGGTGSAPGSGQSRTGSGIGREHRIPDFARTLLFGTNDNLQVGPSSDAAVQDVTRTEYPVDCWELKRLALEQGVNWWDKDAQTQAYMNIKTYLPQLHETAIAILDQYPHISKIPYLLICGIYFSAFEFKRPPAVQSRPPTTPHPGNTDAVLPVTPAGPSGVRLLDENLAFNQASEAIQRARDEVRISLPDVKQLNACAVNLKFSNDALGDDLTLSKEFLHAIYEPMKTLGTELGLEMVQQPSWFDSGENAQVREPSPEEIEYIRDMLKKSLTLHMDEAAAAMRGSLAVPGATGQTPQRKGLTALTTPSTTEGSPYKARSENTPAADDEPDSPSQKPALRQQVRRTVRQNAGRINRTLTSGM